MKPNIVFILADDTGYGDPGCYNPDSLIPTPNIDRLAREGTMFTDAHSQSALCTPTRYGILTGRYYWRTPKGHALVMPYEPPVIEPDRATLPRLMSSVGYSTACIGKWHLGLNYPSVHGGYTQNEGEIDFAQPLTGGPADCGFDYFFGTAGCSTSDPPYSFIENHHTQGIPDTPSTEHLHGLPGFYPGLMASDWVEEDVDQRFIEKAIDFMASATTPFFVYLPISAPHNPWLTPDHATGKSDEGARGDMNVLVDWCVGEIYDALEAQGILDETLLIFTSDNGPMKGENGQRSAGDLRGYKNTPFEGGHRIPFIARWPGAITPGAISEELICLTDMAATFASLTGADLSPQFEDSHDILGALLTGSATVDKDNPGGHDTSTPKDRPAQTGRPTLVSDTGGFASKHGDFAVRWERWKLIVLAPGDDDVMARRRSPVPDAVDGRLLFDLDSDSGEQHNIADQHPRMAEWLEQLLNQIKSNGSRNVVPQNPPTA